MKKNHTAQNKTVAIARFSQSVGCCRQAQVVFFSIHCVIGGVKTRRVPLFGGAPPGFVGSAPQQRRRGSASVAQRPRGTGTHRKVRNSARARGEREGGGGGEWMVLWSGGGEDGWFWKKKGRKERHTPRMKKTNAQ